MEREYGIERLNGRTISKVDGLKVGSGEVKFFCTDGSEWLMYHSQNCCEHVDIEDVVGDPTDLIGKVLSAREDSNDDGPRGEYDDSYTWTFYNIQTDKGAVTIRWYGTSNGYYSESVSFERIK